MSETRKLAAILVSDVVGYSRLAGADEDLILARLRTLRSDLIDPIISVHHGRIVKRTGDGSIIEFRSAVDAVRCAIEAQSGLIERNAGLPPEKRIEFRVGIHVGDVVEEADGDLMGDGVNIAARLQSVAKPGAICLSEDAYRHVKGRLDVAVNDLGPTQLKNIAEPVRIYALEVGAPAYAKVVTRDGMARAPAASPSRKRSIAVASALAIALLLAAGAGAWRFVAANQSPPIASKLPAEAAHLSIVVLPFTNLSGDSAQDYFADGITENLTTDLSRLSGAFVIARNTAFTYKGKSVDAKEVGKEEAARGARSKNPDAIDLTMRGLALLGLGQSWNDKTRNDTARDLFEQALKLDPNDADALAGAAEAYANEFFWWKNPDFDYEAKILDLVDRAIAIAPDSAGPYQAKTNYLLATKRFDDGVRAADAGLTVNPNSAGLHSARGWLEINLGRFDQAKSDLQEAIRLSPRDPHVAEWQLDLGSAELGLGQYEAAIEEFHKADASGCCQTAPLLSLAASYALTGRMDQAQSALAKARRMEPKVSIKWMVEKHAPNLSPLFEGLRKAGLPEQ